MLGMIITIDQNYVRKPAVSRRSWRRLEPCYRARWLYVHSDDDDAIITLKFITKELSIGVNFKYN